MLETELSNLIACIEDIKEKLENIPSLPSNTEAEVELTSMAVRDIAIKLVHSDVNNSSKITDILSNYNVDRFELLDKKHLKSVESKLRALQ